MKKFLVSVLKAASLLVIVLVAMFGAYKGARYVAANQKKAVVSDMYQKAKTTDSLKSGENLTYHLTKLGRDALQPDLYFDKSKSHTDQMAYTSQEGGMLYQHSAGQLTIPSDISAGHILEIKTPLYIDSFSDDATLVFEDSDGQKLTYNGTNFNTDWDYRNQGLVRVLTGTNFDKDQLINDSEFLKKNAGKTISYRFDNPQYMMASKKALQDSQLTKHKNVVLNRSEISKDKPFTYQFNTSSETIEALDFKVYNQNNDDITQQFKVAIQSQKIENHTDFSQTLTISQVGDLTEKDQQIKIVMPLYGHFITSVFYAGDKLPIIQ
ncbi:hypothetical protein R4Y45_00430 [Holzapfeliella sp. He02]|uniref:DUF4179 domain-containing protein n=1 Tax=Holzapfeliella saturejae TaxID=3082953 RepID=A0ABU8SEB8_9LACO